MSFEKTQVDQMKKKYYCWLIFKFLFRKNPKPDLRTSSKEFYPDGDDATEEKEMDSKKSIFTQILKN